MTTLAWVGAEEGLTSEALTVRAQTLPADNAGELIYDAFMPLVPVKSRKIRNIIQQQKVRYTADRREYNAPGRLIPFDTTGTEMIKITPIESYFIIEEEEMQDIEEQVNGNAELYREVIRSSVPDRVDSLVEADWRRVEVDVFRSWSTGEITVRNPQLGHIAQTFSYGIASGHYLTASTAWNDPSVNAFDLFLAWLDATEKIVGLMDGVVLRRLDYNLIQQAASVAISVTGQPMLRLTQTEFEARVTAERRRAFQFWILENTVKEFADGGTSNLTEVELWPAGLIGAVPSVGAPGFVANAPNLRAYEMIRANPDAKIVKQGVNVYVIIAADGKEVKCQAQLTAMPILNEDKICVIDIGTA